MQLRDDSSAASIDSGSHQNHKTSSVPYFEILCWACEQLDYPYEFADIVGSQFLGLEGATPITHVDGHAPSMEELSEFLALAFICIADFAHLTTIFLDDFQWVDAFSWKIFRVLCQRGNKMLLICATRSHDKQALRRMTSAAALESQLQSQMIEISLGPLDFSEIRELMAAALDHKKSVIPDDLCSAIFQKTGGLPVYVVQVLENMKRTKAVELVGEELRWTHEGLRIKASMFWICDLHFVPTSMF
jgi:predicted ATPase